MASFKSHKDKKVKIRRKSTQTAEKYCRSGFVRWVLACLIWLLRMYCTASSTRSFELYLPLLQKMDTVMSSRGHVALIKYCKAVRASVLGYLSGNPDRPPGVKCTKDGIPTALGPLIDELRQRETPGNLPFLMTILFSTRALKVGTSPDFSPISSPPSVEVPDIGEYAKKFWRELRYRPSLLKVPRGIRWTKFHMSTKAGPNGHALWTSLRDLASLPSPLVEDIKSIGGRELSEKIQTLQRGLKVLSRFFPVEPGRFRKLSWFPDREEKVRVIAQLDYFSQTALRPLHFWLYKLLRKIRQDCTFSQGSFKDKLEGAKVFYSIDLTAATDRFPITVIACVLKGVLPADLVDSWVRVMSGYPFDYSKARGRWETVRYAVGNPMGAYSSWASFAVAHHYVVYYCCRKLGKDWRSLPYCLLGDDIVIGDREVAEYYLRVIKSLGVEVSMAKTHISDNFYEFAKRLVYKGQEISPFPLSALREQGSRYYLLVNLLMECKMKEWVSHLGIPRVILDYYELVRPLRRKLRKGIELKSSICELITEVIRGSRSAGDGINTIAGQLRLPRSYTDEEGRKLLTQIVLELFTESDPYGKKGDPLGEKSLEVVTYLSGWEDDLDPGLGLELIYCIPYLGIWGQVEETYMNLKREVAKVDVSDPSWDLTVTSMTIPVSDEVFSMRRKHTTLLASTILGTRVTKALSMVRST